MVAALDLIGSVARDLAEFDRTLRTAPLACVQAWHTANKTSQRRVIQALQHYRTVLACGGNRSGKTWLLRCALVALALGSDHPHARMFWLHHGCDPDAFPRGPGDVQIVALTSAASLEYHRLHIDALLPGAKKWNNRDGKGPAYVRVTVPGYDKPAIIWFKSEDQGEEAFQGASLRAVLHDEEGKTSKVWEECGVRVLDQNGWQLMANTPINGRTWVWDKFVRETPPDVAYREIWTEDNPFLPAGAVAKLAKRNKAAARLRGAWDVAEGRVYESWTRDRHLLTREKWAAMYPDVPFGQPPRDWPRYRTKDFGSTNPCVVLWFFVDPRGRIVVYRSIYRAGCTMGWWAAQTKAAEGRPGAAVPDPAWKGIAGEDERVELAWADPAGAQEIRDLRGMDVIYLPANKAVRAGIDKVREALELRVDGIPGLMILDGAAPEAVQEIESYRYPESKGNGREDELPIKAHDHAMDCTRYGVVGITRMLG